MQNKILKLTQLFVENVILPNDNKEFNELDEEKLIGLLNEKRNVDILINQEDIREQEEYSEMFKYTSKRLMNLKVLNIEIAAQQLSDYTMMQLGNYFRDLTVLQNLKLTFSTEAILSQNAIHKLNVGLNKLSSLKEIFIKLESECNNVLNQLGDLLVNVGESIQLSRLSLILLSSSNFTDYGAEKLGLFLKSLKHLTYMKLQINSNLSIEGRVIIHQSLKQITQLEEFEYELSQENGIGEYPYLELANSLCYLNNLYSLSLNIGISQIAPEVISKLQGSFSNKQKLTIFKFCLQEECMMKEIEIESLFRAFQNLQNLKTFELIIGQGNQLQSSGCSAIKELFFSLKQLENLDIILHPDNFIGRQGLIALSQGVRELKQLQSFYFFLDDDITEETNEQDSDYPTIDLESTKCLAQSIRSLTRLTRISLLINSIHALNLISIIQNDSFSNSNQIYLKFFHIGSFIKDDKNTDIVENKLKQLNISIVPYSRASNIGMKALSVGLQELFSLTHLSLSIEFANNIKKEGVDELSSALKTLVNLTHLHIKIEYSKIFSEGAISLAESIQSLKNLTSLSLIIEQNEIGSSGAISLGQSISTLSKLSYLSLRIAPCNGINNSGCENLIQSISNMFNLLFLFLDLSTDKNLNKNSKYCNLLLSLINLRGLALKINSGKPSPNAMIRKLQRLVICQQSIN